MLIMALDHVREFLHQSAILANPTDLHTTTPALFFTRWITHFCAPVFVFLSGISAYLSGRKKTKKELQGFLLKRGIWLVLVELLIITPGWTFSPFYNLFILQVIWAIGLSMILLSLLVRLPLPYIAATGLLIFLGHNLLDYINNLWPAPGTPGGVLWKLFFTTNGVIFPLGPGHVVFDLYAVLPWTGVMLLGYGAGYFYQSPYPASKRRRLLLLTGCGAVLLFTILRLLNKYGDPSPWSFQRNSLYTFMSFLNTTKYPCSLLYLLMTLGPACIFLSFTERLDTPFSRLVSVYGRVPFFYYVCHLYLVHFICVIVFFASGYTGKDISAPPSPFFFRPPSLGFGLWEVYGIWLLIVFLLYFPCKWFEQYKRTHRQWWLSYV